MILWHYILSGPGGGFLSGVEYKYVASRTADAPAKNCLKDIRIQLIKESTMREKPLNKKISTKQDSQYSVASTRLEEVECKEIVK